MNSGTQVSDPASENTEKALVTNIQKYTIHDGPGIRTEIFFLGCTLSCRWCSNPETIAKRRRIGVYPTKCVTRINCGECIDACPSPELHILHDQHGVIKSIAQNEECVSCFKCADACPPRALKLWGTEYSLAALIDVIEEDRDFYEKSGGGVTISGGEALLWHAFAARLLDECRKRSINTCVESALNVPWFFAAEVFQFADYIITDIKFMDSAKHALYCGAGNELILENIKKTSALGLPFTIRTPVIMGINDDEENIRRTAEFILTLPRTAEWQLLPYRRLGLEKYEALGLEYPFAGYEPPESEIWEENLRRLGLFIEGNYGFRPVLGSERK